MTERQLERLFSSAGPGVAGLLLTTLVSCSPDAPGAGEGQASDGPTLSAQSSAVTVRLQAVSVVGADTVWASGLEGTWVRTTDGGRSWVSGQIPGAEALQLRDVDALSAEGAWILSAGPGEESRIFHTADAGDSWSQQFVNSEPEGFYDCLALWDEKTAVVFGDSVAGGMRIMRTEDGGASWRKLLEAALPPALEGEGGFAASGTCAVAASDGRGWVGTGAARPARVLVTEDLGRSWRAQPTPMAGGEAAGITSLALLGASDGRPERLVAVGGKIGDPDQLEPRVVASEDGGVTWRMGGEPVVAGPLYGVAAVPGAAGALVAVGPGGAQLSRDWGESWQLLTREEHWSVAFGPTGVGWMVGPEGRITRLELDTP